MIFSGLAALAIQAVAAQPIPRDVLPVVVSPEMEGAPRRSAVREGGWFRQVAQILGFEKWRSHLRRKSG